VRLLLTHGADVNALHQSVRPLHVACREPSSKTASSTLTKRDAKGDAKDASKAETKSEAKEPASAVEIASILLQAGANPNLRDAAGSFPLHHAVHNAELVVCLDITCVAFLSIFFGWLLILWEC
jgi:ankyrin repeat protein